MAKTKRKGRHQYQPPPQGDVGPATAAQLDGAEILTIREDNGAMFRRKRRDHALDLLYKGGKISNRQWIAGMTLFEAHCKTEMSPDSSFTKIYVDSTPDYTALILRNAERSSEFGRLYYCVPIAFRGPINHVAVCGLQLRAGSDTKPPYSRDGHDASSHMAMLQVALDLVANELRI